MTCALFSPSLTTSLSSTSPIISPRQAKALPRRQSEGPSQGAAPEEEESGDAQHQNSAPYCGEDNMAGCLTPLEAQVGHHTGMVVYGSPNVQAHSIYTFHTTLR